MSILNQNIEKTKDPNVVFIVSMNNCPYCVDAKALVQKKGYQLIEIDKDQVNSNELEQYKTGSRLTFPRCFMGGQLVGGFTELNQRLAGAGPGPGQPRTGQPGPGQPKPKPNTSNGALPGWLTAPPAARPEGTPSSLEEGLFAAPSRKLNFEPMISSIGKTLDPMFADLKRCMCEGFADLFVKSAPVVIDTVIQSMLETAVNDDQTHAYLQEKLKNLILTVKNTKDKDRILRNLDGECRQVFVQMREHEEQTTGGGGGGSLEVKPRKETYRFTRKLYNDGTSS